MNLLIITGNLGQDVEVKTHNQKQVLNFSVAVTKKYKDGVTGQQVTETTWVRCSYWTKSENLAQYLKRGTQVLVKGEAKVSAYLKNEITPTGSLECFVHDLELIGGKPSEGSSQERQEAQGHEGEDEAF
jgi:single-strand DNA-binding protein